jgi:hypothetical protein
MTTDTNPHLTTLYVTRSIGEEQPTSEWLCTYYGLSPRTLKRHIEEARHLGAKLKAVRMMDRRFHWTCENWPQIHARGLLAKWIELEEQRQIV